MSLRRNKGGNKLKKRMKMMLVTALGASVLFSAQNISVSAQTVDTNANVTITDGEITPTLPTGTLTFPAHTFSFAEFFGAGTSYNKTAESGTVSLSVDDQRSLNGITDGWKITASLSSFNRTGGGLSLGNNTTITFNSVDPVKVNTYNASVQPQGVSIPLTADGQAVNFLSANRGVDKVDFVGLDTWTLDYANTDISLAIPDTDLVDGEHTATITWVFSDTIN